LGRELLWADLSLHHPAAKVSNQTNLRFHRTCTVALLTHLGRIGFNACPERAIMHALKYPGILENHFHLVFPPGSGVCQENTNYAG
jgi:hypothetical protein